ncbi:MAG TPA: DHHA1 domain-containing protein [Candidatus Omnitrophota bacterium]|nr:DHHA1 domain-containing protein [Candidatus Omnitrophota bacterium]
MTRRLYYEDSHRDQFEAAVLSARPDEGGTRVVLDATAFYPGGGGQPSDRGVLGGRAVLEVGLEGDELWHRVEGALESGARVEGRLDWARRFDHMQQHTGQHILSRAFVEVARADTRSFHLGEAVVTIDVDHPGPDAGILRKVEDRANAVVWEDRPVATHLVSLDRAREFPLRKAPDVEGEVRVVEVEGFDWSACGGTHVARSGQVGMIALLGTEKYKGGTRVAFACGGRALARLREASDVLRGLCLEFTSGEADLPRAIARLKGEVRRLESRLKPLLAESLAREAEALLAAAEPGVSGPVVARYFPDRDPAELAAIAAHVAGRGGIALLAAGRDIARAHFSAPKGTISVGALFAGLASAYGAKGGGRPEAAQGAIPADRAEEAIDAARRAALAGTNQG